MKILRASLPGCSNSSSKSETNNAMFLYILLFLFSYFRIDIINGRGKKARVDSKSYQL